MSKTTQRGFMSLPKSISFILVLLAFAGGAARAQGDALPRNEVEREGASLSNAGMKLLQQGDYAGAEGFFRKAIYNFPNHKSPQYGLGKALLQQRKFSEAIGPLKRACELDPRDVRYRTALALCYSETGDNRASSAMLEKLLLEPLAPDVKYDILKNLSFDYTKLRNYKGASEIQKQLIALDPKTSENYFYLGVYQQKAGLFSEAKQSYKAFLSRFPGDTHANDVRKELAKIDSHSASATSSYVGRWPAMPVSVSVATPNTTLKGYKPNFQALVGRALKSWQDSSSGSVSFQLVAPEKAQILITFVDDPASLVGDHMGKTILTMNPQTRSLSKARMLLPTIDFQTNEPRSELTIEALALHEIGHALGLPHSGNQKDAMFPAGQNNGIELTTPSANDVLWLRNLYTYKKPAAGGSAKPK
jgi:tetratricopeptide (TPR) repeat protein